MKNLFAKLLPFQKAEFALMLLLAFSIPFYWYVAQIFEVALVTCALLKVIFQQKFHFNETQMRWKWVYIIFMSTWIAYLIGMIHTQNVDEGWFQISKKLGFLLFPMIFLFSDVSYLTKDRFRAIFYSLVAGTLLIFLINFTWAIIDIIFNNYDTSRLFDDNLMKLYYVHHTYLSMYAALAFAFCFTEFYNNKCLKLRMLNTVAMMLLLLLIFLVESRAGIITIFLEIVVLCCWITFVKKEKKFGIISSTALVAVIVLTILFFPGRFSRIKDTITNISSQNSTDRRLVQFDGFKEVMEENWLWGVGIGDRTEEIIKSYEKYKENVISSIVPMVDADQQNFEENRARLLDEIMKRTEVGNYNEPNDQVIDFIKKQSVNYDCDTQSVIDNWIKYIFISNAITNTLDAHNQYLDTMISVGIIGVLLMFAYFIIPIVIMAKKKKIHIIYLIFIAIISFNALFESVFEGQIGIIFFNFFNMLLFSDLIINLNSKDSQNEK